MQDNHTCEFLERYRFIFVRCLVLMLNAMDKAKVVRHQQNLTDRLNYLFVHDVHTAIMKSLSRFRTEWVVYDVANIMCIGTVGIVLTSRYL